MTFVYSTDKDLAECPVCKGTGRYVYVPVIRSDDYDYDWWSIDYEEPERAMSCCTDFNDDGTCCGDGLRDEEREPCTLCNGNKYIDAKDAMMHELTK